MNMQALFRLTLWVWIDMQTKLKLFLANRELSKLKLSNFMAKLYNEHA